MKHNSPNSARDNLSKVGSSHPMKEEWDWTHFKLDMTKILI